MAIEKYLISDAIVGHEATFKKLLQLIEKERVPSGLLFVGPSGQGKKLVAWAFAQNMLCESSSLACGSCAVCKRVFKGSSEGVIFIEAEKNVIKIEAIRALREQLSLAAAAKARLVIIDDAHLMNTQAANALLKSLEEPPAHTHFVLLSSSSESLPRTIRSRLQLMRFRNLTADELNKIKPQDEELKNWQNGIHRWGDLLLQQQEQELITQIRESAPDRETATLILSEWLRFVRDVWLLKRRGQSVHETSEEQLAILSEMILSAIRDVAGNADVQLLFENLILQFCRSAQFKSSEVWR